jgi:hypothetical protein
VAIAAEPPVADRFGTELSVYRDISVAAVLLRP